MNKIEENCANKHVSVKMNPNNMSKQAIDLLLYFPHKENIDGVYEYDSELYSDYCGPHVIRLLFVLYKEMGVRKISWYHRNLDTTWPYKLSTVLEYDQFVKTYMDTPFYKTFVEHTGVA